MVQYSNSYDRNVTLRLAIMEQVEKFQQLAAKTEAGATFNADGTNYDGDGVAVTLQSTDYNLNNVSCIHVAYEAISHLEKLDEHCVNTELIKVGLFKFPNQRKMSLDYNLVLPPADTKVYIDFARWAGQQYLWDFAQQQCIETGTVYHAPRDFEISQYSDIIESLSAGLLPECVDLTDHERFDMAA